MVTEMADLRWRLRRVPAFESQLLSLEVHKLCTDVELKPLLESLHSDSQILALAFQRLVQNKVLPNLLNLESRLARRVEKIQSRIELTQQRRLDRDLRHSLKRQQVPIDEPAPSEEEEEESEQIQNLKNEAIPAFPPNQPIRVPLKPGRNDLCPCGSNLKFKRCCLGKQPETPVDRLV